MSVPQKNKALLSNIIALLIGIIFSVFIGEICSRVYFFGIDGLSYKKVSSFMPVGVSGYLSGSKNYEVLYELKPNIDSYFKLSTFRTNSQGCRDKEYELTKPQKTIRGLVIGDSFTMGSGVEIENVYHSVVETTLNEKPDGINYELINFGVGGYNLLNYKGVLENKTLQYNPDFIVIGFCGNNDFMLPHEKHYEGNYKVKVKDKTKNPFFSAYLMGWIKNTISPKQATTKTFFAISEKEKAFVEKMFNEFRMFSEHNNIPIIINFLSILEDNGNLQVIKNIALKNGLYFVDGTDEIDNNRFAEYCINKLDHHPNESANRIFANALLSFDPLNTILNKKKEELLSE